MKEFTVSRSYPIESSTIPYWIVALVWAVVFLSHSVKAQLPVAEIPADRKESVNFATEIYPFLKANCLACHNTTKAKADLILESPQDMVKGGESGTSIVPGDGENSFLFTTSAHIEEPTMPPPKNKSKAKNLTPMQLALLKRWIDEGAKGGAVAAPAPTNWTRLTGAQPIYTSAITESGRFAAVGRGQGLHVYDLLLEKQVASLVDPEIKDYAAAHLDFVQTVTFSPDGRLASGGYRVAKIWERSGAAAGAVAALPEEPTAMVVSRDRKWSAVGHSDGSIVFTALTVKGAKPVTVKDHGGAVTGLCFLPTNDGLVSISADKTLRVRKFAAPEKAVVTKLPAEPRAVVVIDAGKQVAVGFVDKKVRVYTTGIAGETPAIPVSAAPTKPRPAKAPPAKPAPKKAAPAAKTPPAKPAPKKAAPAAKTPPAKAAPKKVAPATKPPAKAPPAKPTAPEPPTFSVSGVPTAMALAKADGSEFLVTTDTGKLIHFKTAKFAHVRTMAHVGPIHHVAIAPNFTTVAVSGDTPATRIRIFNLADGKQLVEVIADTEISPKVAGFRREIAIANRLKAHWDKKIPMAEKSAKDELAKAGEAAVVIAKGRRDLVAKKAALAVLNTAKPKPKADAAILTKAQDELVVAERTLSGAERNRDLSIRLAGVAQSKQAAALAGSKEAETLSAELTAEVDAITKAVPELLKKIKTTGLAFSPDGATLAQVLPDGTVRLFSAKNGAWLESFPTLGGAQFIAFTGTNRILLTARKEKKLIAWNIPGAKWTLAKRLGDGKSTELFIDRVTALEFSPDSSKLATGTGVASRNGQLKLFDTADWSVLATNDKAHEDSLTALTFSPFGKRIASASTDTMVKVFGTETLAHETTFEGHTGHVLDVDWNDSGLTLVSSGADKQVKIWDIAEGQQLKKVEGYFKEVSSVEFVAGTDTTLTASGDEAVKYGNVPLPGAGDTFYHTAAASADAKVIIAGGQDGTLLVWDARAKKLKLNFPAPDVKKVAASGK